MLSSRICPRPTPGMLGRDVGDEYLFYDASSEQVHVLNATAREIFLMCDGRCSVEDVVRGVVERYDVDEETARRDVEAVLQRLCELGLVQLG